MQQIFMFSDSEVVWGQWDMPTPEEIAMAAAERNKTIQHIHTATLSDELSHYLSEAAKPGIMIIPTTNYLYMVIMTFGAGWKALDEMMGVKGEGLVPLTSKIGLDWQSRRWASDCIYKIEIKDESLRNALEEVKKGKGLLVTLENMKTVMLTIFSNGWMARQAEIVSSN